ncbi:hypothetical protein ACK1X7_31165 [Streptomyces sp. CY1]|uniref:hypothetical protein n=1 Tax=Streptomyces sp. CY1 TaxID=3388313 RepID=UPI0039A06BAF
MTHVRDLWWRAGRLAFPVSTETWLNDAWVQSVYRSATLLEPAWPTDFGGGSFVHALPTVALVLYAGDVGGRPEYVPVDKLVDRLTLAGPGAGESSIEDIVREGLTTKRRHDLDNDSQLSAVFHQLTVHRPPLTHSVGGMELPSMEQWPGGTLMAEAARWAKLQLTHHHLSVGNRA